MAKQNKRPKLVVDSEDESSLDEPLAHTRTIAKRYEGKGKAKLEQVDSSDNDSGQWIQQLLENTASSTARKAKTASKPRQGGRGRKFCAQQHARRGRRAAARLAAHQRRRDKGEE